MWHRVGGLVITTSNPGLRVDEQDWSELTLELFPSSSDADKTVRRVYNRKTLNVIQVVMTTDGRGQVVLDIDATPDGDEHSWIVRVHLAPGQSLTLAEENEEVISSSNLMKPLTENCCHEMVPFKGKGSRPAPQAGPVAELLLPSSTKPRHLVLVVS